LKDTFTTVHSKDREISSLKDQLETQKRDLTSKMTEITDLKVTEKDLSVKFEA